MTDTHTHCCTGPVDDRQLQDPVCGMQVTPRSPFSYKLLDKTYYFCSKRCLSQFQAAFIRVSDHAPAGD
jgi:YHS domain-containing protein